MTTRTGVLPAQPTTQAFGPGGVIRTDRLTLRPFTEADREAFIETVRTNLDHLSPWLPLHESGESDDDFFDRLLALCAEGDARGTARRRLAVLDDGSIAGCFHLNSISRGLDWDADAVWWITRSHSGRGLATEGLRAVVGAALEPMPAGLGLHGVHCGIEPANEASVRVAGRCGFEHRPGRRSYLKVGDRWVMHEFYLARPESVSRHSGR